MSKRAYIRSMAVSTFTLPESLRSNGRFSNPHAIRFG